MNFLTRRRVAPTELLLFSVPIGCVCVHEWKIILILSLWSLDVKQYELSTIKKLVAGSMGREGAELVNGYLERLAHQVSSLEQICLNQERILRSLSDKVIRRLRNIKFLTPESHSRFNIECVR